MLVGLVGFIGSGKNTAAEYLTGHLQYSPESFARTLKDVVSSIFGWDRSLLEGDTEDGRLFRDQVDGWWAKELNLPDFTPRKALQVIGTDVIRNGFNKEIWVLTLKKRLAGLKNAVVTDARFTNEIDSIRSAGGIIVRVKRGDDPVWYDVAAAANSGCAESLNLMATVYSDIHVSEWGWIGSKIDYEINNDSSVEELHRHLANILLLSKQTNL